MSWLQQLYRTYEAVSQDADIQNSKPLMPYYHVNQNVQIIITINDAGEFLSARLCRDDSGKPRSIELPLPATSRSSTRTGSLPPPHPLSDKVQYIAKNYYEKYAQVQTVNFFEPYFELLSGWSNSDYCHPKALAVLNYVSKGQVIDDLVKSEILFLDKNNKLATPSQASDFPDSIFNIISKKDGHETYDQGTAVIAWEVEPRSIDKIEVIETWLDSSLALSWQKYCEKLQSEDKEFTEFCYVLGKHSYIARKHPKKVMNTVSGAKLISANDKSGFTFRGRFTDDSKSISHGILQGVNVSLEASQKIHSILTWLITYQGTEQSKQAVVAWAISGSDLPQPTDLQLTIDTEAVLPDVDANDPEAESFGFEDSWGNFDYDLDYDTNADNESSQDGLSEVNFADSPDVVLDVAFNPENEVSNAKFDTENSSTNSSKTGSAIYHHKDFGKRFSEQLQQKMAGYRGNLAGYEQVSVISLDSATPGRMAVTYYYQTMPEYYFDALEAWQQQFAWYTSYKDNDTEQYKIGISAPTPYQIAQSAYGKRVTDAVKKQVVSQVLPCIVEGTKRQIPYTLVHQSFTRACNPMNQETWEWQQLIEVTCGLYRGYFFRQTKQEISMELDPNRTDRSYLFGRLLAIANHIENLAMAMASEGFRPTNAMKYMQRFTRQPADVWMMLRTQYLLPYQKRLIARVAPLNEGYNDLMGEIEETLKDMDAYNSHEKLSPEFIIGYDLQARWLKKHTIKDGKWVVKPDKKADKKSAETVG